MAERDVWARWLLERRFAGQVADRDRWLGFLGPIRDRVLDRAALRPDDVVLDVGAGDGLVAFEALTRLGPDGSVVISDISEDLLAECRSVAASLGVADRCAFVEAAAEDLAGVDDGSVDVVTTRSVLIYVRDKPAAFAAFFRVLRPGGRISLYEPVNSYFGVRPPPGRWWGGYDVEAVGELAERVQAVYQNAQPVERSPMMDFDDRDLVRLAEQAGFDPVGLELRVEVARGDSLLRTWEEFLHAAPNPRAPTLAEAVATALSPDEADRFLAHLRDQVESGGGVRRLAHAYLSATKPRDPPPREIRGTSSPVGTSTAE